MTKETGNKVARLAARRLSGEIKKLTPAQELSVCASCVAQAEAEQEGVKAWAGIVGDKIDSSFNDPKIFSCYIRRSDARNFYQGVEAVLITRLRPRADKRTQARKRK